MGFFYKPPLNPTSLTCGSTAVEATPGKKNQLKRSTFRQKRYKSC